MPPVTAIHRIDKNMFPYGLTEVEPGKHVGVRTFEVHTSDPDKALTDSDVPAMNTSWSDLIPNCRVRSREVTWVNGLPLDNASSIDTPPAGCCVVRCDYATPGTRGSIYVPSAPDAFTEIIASPTTITARYPIQRYVAAIGTAVGDTPAVPVPGGSLAGWGSPVGTLIPIQDGDGAPMEFLEVEVRVTLFQALATPLSGTTTPMSRLLNLGRPSKVNDAIVTTPRLINTGTPGSPSSGDRFAFGIGQLRYRGFEIGEQNGFRRLTHIMVAAEDHWHRWQVIKSNAAAGSIYADRLYEYASFAGLWP